MRKAAWIVLGILFLAATASRAKADNIALVWTATSGATPSVVGAITYNPTTDSLSQVTLSFDGIKLTDSGPITTNASWESSNDYSYTCTAVLTIATCTLYVTGTLQDLLNTPATITLTGTGTASSGLIAENATGTVVFKDPPVLSAPEPSELGLTLLGIGLVLLFMRKRIAQGLRLPAVAPQLPALR
jgi:hypothetical protein